MHAAKRLCVGGVFGVLSVLVFQVQLVYGQENGVCDLQISRGNVKSLLVGVHCPNHAPSDSYNASWEYKQSINESWKPLTNVGKHRHINALYFLKGLLPDTLYYIRAFLPHLGNYTAIKEGWTCPTVPPPVAALREGGAGPGWLDVRWNRPTELCRSILIFLVRYNVVDLPPGPEKVFGIINSRVGYARINPSHPCPDSEFCVLFTDRVQPGRKHTVEVRTKRYDVDEHEEGEPQRITVLADSEVAENLVNVSAKRSTEQTKARARHASDFMLQDVVLPLWILVLVGGMSFILLLIAIACLCTSFRRKNSLPSNNIYGPVRIEEMPSSLSLPVIHIYDYPQLPLKKENSTFCC